MSKSVRGLLFVFLILVVGVYAQTSLLFEVIESGGNEYNNVESARFGLSSNIGQSTPVSTQPITGAIYTLHPGYRKVDLDLRYPFTWFTLSTSYSADTSFLLTWSGQDTTTQDGDGWGIWNYDLEYMVGSSGSWIPWLTETEDTSAVFGPDSPELVAMGETYYFRLRARDKVNNVAPWTVESQDSVTVDFYVQFCIHTYAPGEPTTSTNFATLDYFSEGLTASSIDLWEGSCVNIWCVPNEEAVITRRTSHSDTQERWIINTPTDDTSWVIDGSVATYDVSYWHQIKPIITLDGTDPTHTVRTLEHKQFGMDHLDIDEYSFWSEWTDYGSLIEFIDSTTGSPSRFVVPEDSTRFHDISEFFMDTIHYSADGNRVTIQTNFGGNVLVDGVWRPSPYSTNWFTGSSHDIGVYDTVVISDCEIYVFDQWSDGSRDTFRTVSVSSESTFTAYFNHKFRVDIDNPLGLGTPHPSPGPYWVDAGDTATGYMDTTGITDYILVGYIGTGSALSGGGTEFWFDVWDCSSISWNWVPMSDDLCTLYVYSEYGHPHPEGMYIVPNGTTIYLSVEDSTYEDGSWRHCTGWLGDGTTIPATGTENILSFTITGSGWLVWQWDGSAVLPLMISSTPDVYGPPNPDVGTHWIRIGSDVDAFVESNPDGDYWCIGYNSFGSIMTSSADSVNFTLLEPTGIEWDWLYWPEGYPLDTLWIFSRFGDPTPAMGRHIYPSGITVTAFVNSPDGSHICDGWTGTGSVPPTGDSTHVSFLLANLSTLTWDWDGDDLIPFMVNNPAGYGSPVPPEGVHWHPPLTLINAYVSSPHSVYYCVGYYGFGDLPSFGYENHVLFTLTRASGVEWLWDDDVVTLEVIAPDYSEVIPPSGITYHPVGRHIEASVIDSVYDDSTHRHLCLGWEGDGIVVPSDGDSNEVDFDMIANGTITWNYDDQFLLSLNHDGLPSGASPDTLEDPGWYSSGDTATLFTDSLVEYDDNLFIFVEWTSDSGSPDIADVNEDSTSIIMDDAYNITAVFNQGFWSHIIKLPAREDSLGWIIVDTDTFYTDTVSQLWIRGEFHDIEVTSEDANYQVAYEFSNWQDDLAATETRTVCANDDTSFIAQYDKFCHIIIEKYPDENIYGRMTIDGTNYNGGASIRQEAWWLEGSIHRIEVSEADSSSVRKFYFNEWNDGSALPVLNYGPVEEYDSLVARYSQLYRCHVEKDPREPFGFISIAGERFDGESSRDFWAEDGEVVPLTVSKYDVTTDSVYIFNHWDVEGFPIDTTYLTPPIHDVDTFIAAYDLVIIDLDFEIGHDGVFPNDSVVWELPDTLEFGDYITLSNQDSIKIYNYSNVRVQMGLVIGDIYDVTAGWSLDTIWYPGYTRGVNRFAIYARFNDYPEPPISWSWASDYIKQSVSWADDELFGEGGYNIGSPGDGENTEMLWMSFHAPIYSDNLDHTRCVVVNVQARMYMP